MCSWGSESGQDYMENGGDLESPKNDRTFLPDSGDLDLTSSDDEDADSAPHDCTYSNA